MRILFVVNNCYVKGNGLSASAQRTVAGLRQLGHEVRVLSGANPDPRGPQPEYVLPDAHVPVFDGLIHAQGYCFARAERSVLREAVRWAEVIHLEEPFPLQWHTLAVARSEGRVCTATYHLHPENLLSSVHLGHWRLPNHLILRWWRDHVFNRCAAVQCPPRSVQRRLEAFRFRPPLYLISNGIQPLSAEEKAAAPLPAVPRAPYILLCVGRYSVEKDQKTLLRAMRYSRHAKDIQLVLAGRGPQEKRLKSLADRLVREGTLVHPPRFGFYSMAELTALAEKAALYVHCADVEVEGLGCLEALRVGLVPVLADGELTATAQFALGPDSVFPAGDERKLAERIDHWLDRPEALPEEAARYRAVEQDYDIADSLRRLAQMMEAALKGDTHGKL